MEITSKDYLSLSTIEQFIIDVYRLYHNREVLLVAPTGKAARRMSESTGEAALTIHKALGISSDTELSKSNTRLAAGLIIIDEASMLDCRVTYALLRAIQTGAHVVFVGDTNQLPSVGVGNVLYELINSGVLPIAALETVYRQKAGSTIAVNCARIKRGITDLEYSSTFQFISVHSQHEAAKKALELYRNELETGLTTENVCLLSPFRRSTETGVNLLNEAIQKTLNANNKTYLKYGNKEFFLGDKVMFMANRSEISNGDVGYIISMDIAKKTFVVDYGDSRVFSYQKSDLRYFDLAYGISIHKSQGAEFTTCIIIVMDEHRMMLNRNLIYTAISRAKNKVVLVGTKTALDAAISTEDVSRRQSRLGALICELKK